LAELVIPIILVEKDCLLFDFPTDLMNFSIYFSKFTWNIQKINL